MKFDLFAIDGDPAELEINSDGGEKAFVEGIVNKSDEDGGFADRRVADQNKFEFIIRGWYHFIWLYIYR